MGKGIIHPGAPIFRTMLINVMLILYMPNIKTQVENRKRVFYGGRDSREAFVQSGFFPVLFMIQFFTSKNG